MTAIREALAAKGGISGVINIVSYGYHEYHLDRGSVFNADGSIRPEYLQRHRQEEISQLSEWNSLLGSPLTAKWLITLVTKADLWWDHRKDVVDHYKTGPYFAALGDAKSLQPKVIEYSSVFARFYNTAPMSGFFAQDDRTLLQNHFVEALLAALLKDNV